MNNINKERRGEERSGDSETVIIGSFYSHQYLCAQEPTSSASSLIIIINQQAYH